MRTCLCLIVVLFVAAAAAAPQTNPAAPQTKPHAVAKVGTDASSVQKAIEAANTKSMQAMAKGDVKGAMANYAEDAVVMMPGAPMWKGHAAIVKAMQEFMDTMTVKNPMFHTQDVMVAGNLAVETGTFDWTLEPKGGAAFQEKGKYLTVWKHQPDGSWKIVRDINNSDQPPK
jgi:uncharacterized protein (TIGR02246 family)